MPIAPHPSLHIRAALVRTTLLAAFGAALLPAQSTTRSAPPPVWRILRELEIEGATLPRDAIAAQLAVDRTTLLTLHRGFDDAAASSLADRIATLHQANGCRDATATAALEGGRVRVTVTPGTRYRCATIRWVGNDVLQEPALVAALTADDGGEPLRLFVSGTPADTSPHNRARIERRIADAYAAVGRHDVHPSLSFEADGETLQLVVTLHDEGHQVSLDRVQLAGEPDDEVAAAVLAWASPPAGQPLTTAAARQLRQRLESTGRYQRVELDLPDALPPHLDPLVVHVQLVDEPPPFDAERLADIARVNLALDRQLELLRDGAWVVVTGAIEEVIPLGMLGGLEPGRLRAAWSKHGMQVTIDRLRLGSRPATRFALALDGRQASLTVGEHTASWSAADGVWPRLQLQLSSEQHATGHEFRTGFGTTFAKPAGIDFACRMHPAFAARVLANVEKAHDDGDDLVLKLDDATLRIAPDGSLRDGALRLPLPFGGDEVAILTEGPPAPGTATPTDPAAVLLDLATAMLAGGQGSETDRRRVEAMAGHLVQAIVAAAPTSRTPDEPEVAQGSLGEDVSNRLGIPFRIASVLATSSQVHGPLVEIAGFTHALQIDERAAAAEALRTITSDPGCGPLSLALVGLTLDLAGMDEFGRRMRELGEQRWSFDAICTDVTTLIGGVPELGTIAADIATAAGAAMRRDPQLQQLFSDIPDGPDANVAAFRAAARYWWSHGGEELLERLLLDD